MRELLPEIVISINQTLVNRTGESHAVLDMGRLESAIGNLYQPYETKEDAYASVFKSLIINHPFKNGNKRTAFVVLFALKKPELPAEEIKDLIIRIASEGGSKITVQEIATTLYGKAEEINVVSINNIIDSGQAGKYLPEYLYHATFEGTLQAIKERGLGNLKGGVNAPWGTSNEDTVGVYLDTDAGSAYAFTETSDDDRLDTEEIIVLRIPTNRINANLLSIDSHNDWNRDVIEEVDSFEEYFSSITYFYEGVINYKDITLVDEEGNPVDSLEEQLTLKQEATHIRFIGQDEFDALQRGEIITSKDMGQQWAKRNVLYTFPLHLEYGIDDYFNIAKFLNETFDTSYKYVVFLNVNTKLFSLIPYAKELVDEVIDNELVFTVEENDDVDDLREEVYMVPETRIKTYSMKDVVEIKSVREVGRLDEALTPDQEQYFKDSKVRDKDGNLLVVYHGTATPGFNEFSPMGREGVFGKYKFNTHNVNYFTSSLETAQGYTEVGVGDVEGDRKNIYACYLNIINPYTVSNNNDGENNTWNNIKDKTVREYELKEFQEFYNRWKNKATQDNLEEINKELTLFNVELRPNKESKEYYDLITKENNTKWGERVLLYAYDIEEYFNEDLYEDFVHSIIGEDDDYYYTIDYIVRWVIYMNETQGTNYDGVVVEDVYDIGPKGSPFFTPESNIYVTIKSGNQIKKVSNESPTSSNRIDEDTSQVVDSEGNTMSPEQVEFFKNSKARDANHNLLVLYHGTNSEFKEFDRAFGGASNSRAKIGFWFTPSEDGARFWAQKSWWGTDRKNPKVVKAYLNITNPKIYETKMSQDDIHLLHNKKEYQLDQAKKVYEKVRDIYYRDRGVSFEVFDDLFKVIHPYYGKTSNGISTLKEYVNVYGEYIDKSLSDELLEIGNQIEQIDKALSETHYGDSWEQLQTDIYALAGMSAEDANIGGMGKVIDIKYVEEFRDNLIRDGYDGIILLKTRFDTGTFGDDAADSNTQYVVFHSNQIKEVSNQAPTGSNRIDEDLTEDEQEILNKVESYFEGGRLSGSIYILPNGNTIGCLPKDRDERDNFDFDEHQNIEMYLMELGLSEYNRSALGGNASPTLSALGAIRLGDSEYDNNYIELSDKRPTNAQYTTLLKWLEENQKHYRKVVVTVLGMKKYKEYDYQTDLSDGIIKKIKRYYTTGTLVEELNELHSSKNNYHTDTQVDKENKKLYNKSMIESLKLATPYMLRNDGEFLECGDVHPYVKYVFDADTRSSIIKLFTGSRIERLLWFYDNTRHPSTKKLIKELIYLLYNKCGREGEYNLIEIPTEYLQYFDLDGIDIGQCSDRDIENHFETINNATNQEFCRARTSNLKFGGKSQDIYFRISSQNFNWFPSIWDIVNTYSKFISSVTIAIDSQATGRPFKLLKLGGTEANHMPTDEFLTLKGNPIIEQKEPKNEILKMIGQGNTLVETFGDINPHHLVRIHESLMEEYIEDNFSGSTTNKKELRESLKLATPYMLRNDGALLECGSLHPYINYYGYKGISLQESIHNLFEDDIEMLIWFYENTTKETTKKLIDEFVSAIYSVSGKSGTYSDIEVSKENLAHFTIDNRFDGGNVVDDDIEGYFDAINNETNQEFIRVRTSHPRTYGPNRDVFIRIGSHNFNWFPIIWKFVIDNKDWIKHITIERDWQIKGDHTLERLVINGVSLDSLPIEYFLTLKGNPVLEQLESNSEERIIKTLNRGGTLVEAIGEINPQHYRRIHNILLNTYLREERDSDRLIEAPLPTDSEGNVLTPEQADFFRDSKVRDELNDLLVVYHGTSGDFSKFKRQSSSEIGFHFGTRQAAEERNPEIVMECYLNITKPLVAETDVQYWDTLGLMDLLLLREDKINLQPSLTQEEFNFLKDAWNDVGGVDYLDDEELEDALDSRGILKRDIMVTIDGASHYASEDYEKDVLNTITSRGYDGIQYINWGEDAGSTSYMAFYPNQIKRITNISPTNSKDINEAKDKSKNKEKPEHRENNLKDTKSVEEFIKSVESMNKEEMHWRKQADPEDVEVIENERWVTELINTVGALKPNPKFKIYIHDAFKSTYDKVFGKGGTLSIIDKNSFWKSFAKWFSADMFRWDNGKIINGSPIANKKFPPGSWEARLDNINEVPVRVLYLCTPKHNNIIIQSIVLHTGGGDHIGPQLNSMWDVYNDVVLW